MNLHPGVIHQIELAQAKLATSQFAPSSITIDITPFEGHAEFPKLVYRGKDNQESKTVNNQAELEAAISEGFGKHQDPSESAPSETPEAPEVSQ